MTIDEHFACIEMALAAIANHVDDIENALAVLKRQRDALVRRDERERCAALVERFCECKYVTGICNVHHIAKAIREASE